MPDHEKLLQIIDIVTICAFFTIGCFLGKLMMKNTSDTWLAFNGSAIGVVIIGEVVWWRIRKKLIKKWKED